MDKEYFGLLFDIIQEFYMVLDSSSVVVVNGSKYYHMGNIVNIPLLRLCHKTKDRQIIRNLDNKIILSQIILK